MKFCIADVCLKESVNSHIDQRVPADLILEVLVHLLQLFLLLVCDRLRVAPPVAFARRSDLVVYVPAGTLADYQSASNYSSISSKMVEMSA